MRAELEKIGLPEDLVQILPPPASKDMTQALMQAADLVVATGSQDNVRRAYSSGTPAIGVGTGNVPVIIDETADLDDAAQKICASKIFDNATSCSSENSVIFVDAIYDKAIAALERAGGYMASAAEKAKIQAALWPDGKLEPHADRARCRCAGARLRPAGGGGIEEVLHGGGNRRRPRFSVLRREAGAGAHGLPRQGFRRRQADARAKSSIIRAAATRSVFTPRIWRARASSPRTPTSCACCQLRRTRSAMAAASTTGSNFTLSMGCGTWGGNSITDNLNYRNFLNITHLVTTIPEDKPSEEALFGAYWTKYGQLNAEVVRELSRSMSARNRYSP